MEYLHVNFYEQRKMSLSILQNSQYIFSHSFIKKSVLLKISEEGTSSNAVIITTRLDFHIPLRFHSRSTRGTARFCVEYDDKRRLSAW